MKGLKEAQEWYAKKTNKTIAEFDEYDAYCARVAYDYSEESHHKIKWLETIIEDMKTLGYKTK